MWGTLSRDSLHDSEFPSSTFPEPKVPKFRYFNFQSKFQKNLTTHYMCVILFGCGSKKLEVAYQVRIPVGLDICHHGCAYRPTVFQNVQRSGVWGAAYGTVHYKV